MPGREKGTAHEPISPHLQQRGQCPDQPTEDPVPKPPITAPRLLLNQQQAGCLADEVAERLKKLARLAGVTLSTFSYRN